MLFLGIIPMSTADEQAVKRNHAERDAIVERLEDAVKHLPKVDLCECGEVATSFVDAYASLCIDCDYLMHKV